MDIDVNQYIDIFVEEGKEHLQIMNDSLLELERDTTNLALINEIFRVAHTIKGMAGTMGFTNVANLTHEMENVLQALRSEEMDINEEIIDVIFECFDALEHSVDTIAQTGSEDDSDYEELLGKLEAILSGENLVGEDYKEATDESLEIESDYVSNIVEEARKKGLESFRIDISLDPKCMLKSARAFIIFNTLESIGEIIHSNPSVEDIEDEKFDLDFQVVLVSEVKYESLEEELNSISEVESIQINRIESDPKKLKKDSVEKKDVGKAKEDMEQTPPVIRERKVGKTVRVDIDRLDNLMNLVSELIIIKTRMDDISESTDQENMYETIEYLERITTNLHDAVMKVRMVPIERVFNRFPRMVRDLSKELNKEINLEMSGEETEVDRTVIDEIGDPLIHIIRNSIDHGIEMPEERLEQGKSEAGTVNLNSYTDGNNVIIEVDDDGKGMDYTKIKKTSIEKGLISSEEGDLLSQEEIVDLLFAPGFSTTEEVSDVSGRGVGLDVVKRKIESINGSVEIETEVNKGTKFVIRIPLTLAIIQALLIKLKDEIYAIPLSSITEIINIKDDSIRDVQGQEIFLYRGKTIPVVRLNEVMQIEKKDAKEHVVVVVKKGEKEAGLLVDSLVGQQEIVIKPLGKFLSNTKYLSGATILGNGNISLIIDINSLI